MSQPDLTRILPKLFTELVDGAATGGGAFMLNSGDAGLLKSLDALTPAEASMSVNHGATIAAHARHLQYGLSLMNRWFRDGGNPFASAHWDEAWHTSAVDAAQWEEIRLGLRQEIQAWRAALSSQHDVNHIELTGMISSIAHLAYHLGAIRQIHAHARGPREGTFAPE